MKNKNYRTKLSVQSCLFFLFCCFSFLPLAAQVAVKTANEYVSPNTGPFGYGSNMRGQGNGWIDETVAGIIQKAGGTTLRATLPDHFIETWGLNIRLEAFNHYTGTLGMKDIVCFIEGPSEAHRDKTVYPGSSESSKLFANLYQPIWNGDGTVNQNNYYAHYVYKLVQTYGAHIRYWEVVNEPDYTWNADVAQWNTRAPLPSEMPNVQAPFYHYIRMLRITWEVVKRYNPDDFVTPGGLGYESYLDALLRYTDNPADGSVNAQYSHKGGAYFDVLSYHVYPSYYLRYWDNSIGNFRYLHNSDFAAAQVVKSKNTFEAVLNKYGYNGSTYPKKHLIVTETNISRRTAEWRYGTDEMQRNFGIKALVLAQKNDIKQVHTYGVGESINAPEPSTPVVGFDEYRLMGLYENLDRDMPGSEKLTQQGVGYRTTSKLLAGYTYDAARTAALNLPSTAEGAAFSKSGTYVYVLWAKNPNDKTEVYTTTYSFPTAWNAANVERMEWDHSSTGAVTKQSSQGITLNGSPSFFRLDATQPPTTPDQPSGGCTATGSILREQWDGIAGTSLASVPWSGTPTSSSQLTLFEGPTHFAENYGSRIRGYVCVPQSGNYTFYISGDDDSELWLSTSEDPAAKRKVAGFSGFTNPREWTRYPSQQSAPVYLEAGKRYYIEALHKEGDGGDHLAVGWRLPSGVMEAPIPGSRLSPYVPTSTPPPPPPPPAPEEPSGDDPEGNVNTIAELTAYPNPFKTQTTVQFKVTQSQRVILEVFDLQGRLVKTLFNGVAQAGIIQQYILRASGLKAGTYLVRLTTPMEASAIQVILAK